jgi:hypothetical protein
MDTKFYIVLNSEVGRCGSDRDRMVVGFTTTNVPVQAVPITIKVVSSNLVHGDMYSMQHYVIKFVSDLRQVSGFLHQ